MIFWQKKKGKIKIIHKIKKGQTIKKGKQFQTKYITIYLIIVNKNQREKKKKGENTFKLK
jgi:hypothetical protein